MSKEKQIEELAEHIKNTGLPLSESESEILADVLYMLGYRKQSEGEWVDVEGYERLIYKCSLCGDNLSRGMMLNANYCPNCGAKMKGATDERAD